MAYNAEAKQKTIQGRYAGAASWVDSPAMTALASPPGPGSLVMAVFGSAKSTNISLMAEQGGAASG